MCKKGKQEQCESLRRLKEEAESITICIRLWRLLSSRYAIFYYYYLEMNEKFVRERSLTCVPKGARIW